MADAKGLGVQRRSDLEQAVGHNADAVGHTEERHSVFVPDEGDDAQHAQQHAKLQIVLKGQAKQVPRPIAHQLDDAEDQNGDAEEDTNKGLGRRGIEDHGQPCQGENGGNGNVTVFGDFHGGYGTQLHVMHLLFAFFDCRAENTPCGGI